MSYLTRHANGIVGLLLALILFLGSYILYDTFVTNQSTPVQPEEEISIINLDAADELVAPEDPFLHEEEVVIVAAPPAPTTATGAERVATSSEKILLPVEKMLFEYVAVVDSCGAHFEGECLRVRGGPGTDYPVVASLRNGVVLKVDGKVEREDMAWYKIVFDEWLRYPERVTGDWYVAADYVDVLLDEGDKTIWENEYSTSTQKSITVNRSEQKLYAFEGNELVMEADISTGLELTPTPRGTFQIFKKTPSRYMQGPLPYINSYDYYDLPGVPWNLYFTEQGAVIHGAYWHNSFGSQYSHGCVNLTPDRARELYNWADLGTTVIVKD
jgi:hypothetical protein